VADLDFGLRIIDVSNPASPSALGAFNTPGLALDVVVVGNVAYVADADQGLRIISVANPANPTQTGFYDTAGLAMAVAAAGKFVYLADLGVDLAALSFGSGTLRVLDVSKPSKIKAADVFVTGSALTGIAVTSNRLFLADGDDGVYLLRHLLLAPRLGEEALSDVFTAAGPVAAGLTLDEAYPNPFNPQARLRFSLPETAPVRLEVFDLMGRRVAVLADGVLPAGAHEVSFDGSALASGLYLYRLQTPQGLLQRSMLLMK
jgi:hypothetical protein